jgi:hypothetical protein
VSVPPAAASTGAPAIMAFALFHGAGNGLLTIAKGTLPLAIFGPIGYGLRNGIIAVCGGALYFSRAKHCGSACLNRPQSAHRACGCTIKGLASRS